MFLTNNDLNKIYEYIKAKSVKDSDFDLVSTLNDEDTVTVVQENVNKQISVRDLVDNVFLTGASDFVNVTDTYHISNATLSEVIAAIPYKARKEGLLITFLNGKGNWEIYQFKGRLNQWNIESLWDDIFNIDSFVVKSVLPDEEDLTVSKYNEETGNSYISFKDREYTPKNFGGLGKVILRKNIIALDSGGTTNFLYSDLLTQSNSVYEIRYDFDLGGRTLNIPENCTLEFKGGSFKNGTIVGNNTVINADYNTKIFDNIILEGIKNAEYPIEWWGAVDDGIFDNTKIIQSVLSQAENKTVILGGNRYRITDTLYIPHRVKIKGYYVSSRYSLTNEGSTSTIVAELPKHKYILESDVYNSEDDKRMPYNYCKGSGDNVKGDSFGIAIEGIKLIGNNCFGGIRLFTWVGGYINNVDIDHVKVGYLICRSWQSSLVNCDTKTKNYGIIFTGTCTTFRMDTANFLQDYDYENGNIPVEDQMIHEDYGVNTDWINTCSKGVLVRDSFIGMMNCCVETYDVAIAASEAGINANSLYVEDNRKAITINSASKIIIDGKYGTNDNFKPEVWATRLCDYYTQTRGLTILNNVNGGSIKSQIDRDWTNEQIFNATLFKISCDNPDVDGIEYCDNYSIFELATGVNTIYIDDTVVDDSKNWGFSRNKPIKMNTLLKRMSNKSNHNPYLERNYTVYLRSNVTINEEHDIYGGNVNIASFRDGSEEFPIENKFNITFKSPILNISGSFTFNKVKLTSNGAYYLFKNNVEYGLKGVNINSNNTFLTINDCIIDADRIFGYGENAVMPVYINIRDTNFNNPDISIIDAEATMTCPVYICGYNNNIDIRENYYGSSLSLASLNDRKVYNEIELDSLKYPRCKIGERIRVINNPDEYQFAYWNGEKWTNKDGNPIQTPNYSNEKEFPTTEELQYGTMITSSQIEKPYWVIEGKWLDADGNPKGVATRGTTLERPIDVKDGFQYYDTDLNKFVWKYSEGWTDNSNPIEFKRFTEIVSGVKVEIVSSVIGQEGSVVYDKELKRFLFKGINGKYYLSNPDDLFIGTSPIDGQYYIKGNDVYLGVTNVPEGMVKISQPLA